MHQQDLIIKVCGITRIEDARCVLSLGVDWIGLNLVAGPRQIDLRTAQSILAELDDPSRVVVLIRTSTQGSLDIPLNWLLDHGVGRLQLYGQGSLQAVSQSSSHGLEWIMVHSVTDRASLNAFDSSLKSCAAQPHYVLFDSGSSTKLGGTGTCFDWNLLEDARRNNRHRGWPPVLLAGGLNADNVGDAIAKAAPSGVDVSSGVERSPGVKDKVKIERFVQAVRSAPHGTAAPSRT